MISKLQKANIEMPKSGVTKRLSSIAWSNPCLPRGALANLLGPWRKCSEVMSGCDMADLIENTDLHNGAANYKEKEAGAYAFR